MEDVMIRISVLWIFFAVANAAHYVMYVFEPGTLQKILSEEMILRAHKSSCYLTNEASKSAHACWQTIFRAIEKFGSQSLQKLYEAGSASEKTHNTGGVGSRVVYKNLETSSSIHDNSGNLGEKRPPDRCRALRAD